MPAAASPKTVSSTSSPFLPLDIRRIEVLQDQLLCRDKFPVGETRIYLPLEPDTCKHACGVEWRPVDYLSPSDAIVSSSSPLKVMLASKELQGSLQITIKKEILILPSAVKMDLCVQPARGV